MDCKEATKYVRLYLDRKLDPLTQEAFLDHVEHCSACYEELEMTYMLDNASDLLSAGDLSVPNISRALHEDMNERRGQVRVFYRFLTGEYCLYTLAFWAFLTALAFQLRIWFTNGLF
ncbi:MAG: zf-HC2 domain-containing protein [Lachnospiraceae bacterium]|nr:zf-HC2 domain-containing protein [Lachnospiraceae bacterium]